MHASIHPSMHPSFHLSIHHIHAYIQYIILHCIALHYMTWHYMHTHKHTSNYNYSYHYTHSLMIIVNYVYTCVYIYKHVYIYIHMYVYFCIDILIYRKMFFVLSTYHWMFYVPFPYYDGEVSPCCFRIYHWGVNACINVARRRSGWHIAELLFDQFPRKSLVPAPWRKPLCAAWWQWVLMFLAWNWTWNHRMFHIIYIHIYIY